jgi:hypothetical protein
MSTTPELSCASAAAERPSALMAKSAPVARNEQGNGRFGEVFALRIEGVTGILERYQMIPVLPAISFYSSVDCDATSSLHFAIKSARGIEPWSPLARVRTLTAFAVSSLSPKTSM